MTGEHVRPLKVALVSHYFPPHVGGIENVVSAEASNLAGRGHTVEVLTTSENLSTTVEPAADGYTIRRVAAWNGIEKRLAVPFPLPAPWSVLAFWRAIRAADVVHVHDIFYLTTWLAAVCAVLARKPLVLTQHVHFVVHDSRLVMAVQRAVYATVGRLLVRIARRMVYINTAVEEFLVGLGASPDRLTFLPNGVDTSLFRPADEGEKSAVRKFWGFCESKVLALFVGRFVPKKGYPIVAAAAGDAYQVVFAGGLDEPADDRSRYLGTLSTEDLAQVYRACDIFVLPSTDEGFPLSVQEAMASGLPVVTTDDPAYRIYQLDRDKVSLVLPTVDGVRQALERISADAALRDDMSRYSRDFAVDNFRWLSHTHGLERTYHEAMG